MTANLQTSGTTADVPEKIGPYTLQQRIDETAGTVTYLANAGDAPDAGTVCAVRVLRPERLNDETAVKDFEQGSTILRSLRHPRVITTMEAGQVSGLPYIAFEYVKGVRLGSLVSALAQNQQRMPIDVALLIARDIVDAVSYVNEFSGSDEEQKGVIIQSLSLDSVLVSFEGEAKLLEFSGAAQQPYKLVHPATWSRFTAPELIVPGRIVDQRADVYSIGALMFELSTTRRLINWDSLTPAITRRIFRNLHPLPSDVDASLSVLDVMIDKALQCDPEKRYQTAAALLDDIHNSLERINPACSTRDVREFVRQSYGTLFDIRRSAQQHDGMRAPNQMTTIPLQYTPR